MRQKRAGRPGGRCWPLLGERVNALGEGGGGGSSVGVVEPALVQHGAKGDQGRVRTPGGLHARPLSAQNNELEKFGHFGRLFASQFLLEGQQVGARSDRCMYL